MRIFHTSVSWWSFIRVWVTASLLKSPGLFYVSGQSQQRCHLNGLYSSSYFQVLQSLYQSFGDCAGSTNYNWYHRHFHVPLFFQFSSDVLNFFFIFLLFYRVVSRKGKVCYSAGSLFFFFFFLTIARSVRLAKIWWSVCISKFHKIFLDGF